jgi:predicted lysophospholipase L1 biosynthesis ABC-type transport system permease subunit
VTGLIVVPSVDGVDGVGQDGLVTLDGLAGLRGVPASRAADALVANVRGSASPEHRVALFRRLGGDGGTAAQIEAGQTVFGPPSAIVNVKRIRVVPYLLGGVLSLLVLVTLSHVVITSMHRRRRDIAILRALGGDRRWIAQSMGWQAVAIALVPLAIGVPVGLLAGTRVFHLFADSIGTVNSATASSVVIAVIVAGTLVVALLATFATRGARRNSPAAVLRSE